MEPLKLDTHEVKKSLSCLIFNSVEKMINILSLIIILNIRF